MPGVEILNTTIHYKEVIPAWAIIVIWLYYIILLKIIKRF